MEPPLKSRFPWIIPDALQALASNTGIGVPDSEGVLNPHFQFDVLHPDLPAAFSVFIHRG